MKYFNGMAFRAKCVEVANNVKDFINENRELLIVAVPVVGGVLGSVIRKARGDQQEYLRNHYIYDPRSGVYFKTRKLSNAQRLEYTKRREKGESVSHILESMRVLK